MDMVLGNEDGVALPAPASDGAGRQFTLRGEQQRVHDILAEMGPEIAKIYEVGLLVLGHVDHDEKLPLAAHAARETMSAIAKVYGVTWDEKKLHHELDKLKTMFRKVPRDLVSESNLPQETILGKGLPGFLQQFHRFAEWYGNDVGNRREQAANLFKKLLPEERPDLYQSLASMWVEVYDFFSRVGHHRKKANMEEFVAQLKGFHDCVLATRKPEAVADLDAIDGLIAEVQANGLSRGDP
jgi:hypothetical protein